MMLPRLLPVCLGLACFASAAIAAAPILDPNHPIAREVTAREQELQRALLAGDEPKAQTIFAPEFFLMNAAGLNTRDSYFDGILRKRKITKLEIRESRVAVYGDMAIAWLRIVSTSVGYGKTTDSESVMTDVWNKRDGQWVMVTRHSAIASPPPPAAAPAAAPVR